MKVFITGTDTNVGKTYIAVGILKKLNQLGFSTIGIKPVASGCFRKNSELYNADALMLWQNSSVQIDYAAINPFRFEAPISPHIAAKNTKTELSIKEIDSRIQSALNYPADLHLIEGIGGWFTPLNDTETMADFARAHNLAIILIVDIRLGCLNHALLTYQAIKNANLHLYAWVANCSQPDIPNISDITKTLNHWLDVPCLGIVNYRKSPEQILNFNCFINKENSH